MIYFEIKLLVILMLSIFWLNKLNCWIMVRIENQNPDVLLNLKMFLRYNALNCYRIMDVYMLLKFDSCSIKNGLNYNFHIWW